MLSLDEARAIADAYAARTGAAWFEPGFSERERYWVARVGFIGSMGIVIDKAYGKLTVLGSAFRLKDWLWAFDSGFLERDATLRVLAVHDEEKTVELLRQVTPEGPPATRNPWPRRSWVRARLSDLPAELEWSFHVAMLPLLRQAIAERWLELEVVAPE
mgnify:CR=1 FL=1